MTTIAHNDWRELARREGEGLVVTLLWSAAADRVRVTVADHVLDDELQLEIPGTCALDAFHHPLAYAAGRGLCFGDAMRASLDPQPQPIAAERSSDR
jgi:hypothetical protein